MRVFKGDFDILKKLFSLKSFVFNDFKIEVKDSVLKSGGISEDKTLLYSMSQVLDGEVTDFEAVFSTSEFSRMLHVYNTSVMLDMEITASSCVMNSVEGNRKMEFRLVEHTTQRPELALNEKDFDVLSMEVPELKRIVSDFSDLDASEMTLTVGSGKLSTVLINELMTRLEGSIDVETEQVTGATVRLDSLFIDAIGGLIPDLPVKLKLSTEQPLICEQVSDKRSLTLVIVPLMVP